MNIKIFEVQDNDLPAIWDIIQTYPNFFADDAGIEGQKDFSQWFKQINKGAIVGFTVYGELIGCCYLDDIHNQFASINIIFKKHFNSKHKLLLAKLGLGYFFKQHNLKFIYGLTRITNKTCIAFMKKIGFIFSDILKDYKKVNGVKTDYILGGILYENL